MSVLSYILIFSVLGSVVSLVGGLWLLFQSHSAQRKSNFLAAFAAGALLGATFFDLLPEAFGEAEPELILSWVLAGILTFFLLESFIHWFHHHELHHNDHSTRQATVPLIVLGDTVHNVIDGIVIAATFMVDIRLGILTALAVAAHEIPQEIGDFGVLLHAGMSRARIILFNILSAFATVAASLATYWLGEKVQNLLPVLLGLTAGFFIYISLSDLVPGIHSEKRQQVAVKQSLMLFIGLGGVWLAGRLIGA